MKNAFLAALALSLCACPPVLADVDGGVTAVSLKHAHNDYEHSRPLLDALAEGFQSVEADVWLDGSDIGVSHTGAPFKGSLIALYLQPLEDRINANNGSVYGDGKPFFLWLDLKQGSAQLQDAIASQLAARSWLTRFDDSGVVTQGAVTVLLTGDANAKTALANRGAPRPYARDSNDYSTQDPQIDGRWRTYAVNYFAWLTWDGTGEIPKDQLRQLHNLVNGAHNTGRTIRIYSGPEKAEYWRQAKAAGVDFISVDDLAGLSAVMKE